MSTVNIIPFKPRTAPVAILSTQQIADLRSALAGRLNVFKLGLGVDSTAMLVALHEAGIRPDIVSFADLKSEKSSTYRHLEKLNLILETWGWPKIDVVSKRTLETTGYDTLYDNCIVNESLPSLSFGRHGCSLKWKVQIQNLFVMGAKSGPNKCDPHPLWIKASEEGVRIACLIGYDSGSADMRRSQKPPPADDPFDYIYPLQIIGWKREDCVRAIGQALGQDAIPEKSSCFFCPASKVWELYWLAAHEPDLLDKALVMERVAMTGKHSRFKDEFGIGWQEMVDTAEQLTSKTTVVGIGRVFAWSHWARINHVVDAQYKTLRTEEAKLRFIQLSKELQGDGGNAHDSRSVKPIVFMKKMPEQLAMHFG